MLEEQDLHTITIGRKNNQMGTRFESGRTLREGTNLGVNYEELLLAHYGA